MKPRKSTCFPVFIAAATLAVSTTAAFAQSGSWTGRGNQTFPGCIWGGPANWLGNTIANGAGNTATFGTEFINGYAVTLNTARTLGHIIYNDPKDEFDFILRRHDSNLLLTLSVAEDQPTLSVNQEGRTFVMDVRFSSPVGFAKNGPGRLVLSNNSSTYTGPININAGTLEIGGGTFKFFRGPDATRGPDEVDLDVGDTGQVGDGNYQGPITIAEDSTFFYNSSADTSLSGDISGAGSLAKGRGGLLTLAGENTYDGGTSVSGGALIATSAAALPGLSEADRIVFDGGTIGVLIGGSGWTPAEVDTLLANATKTAGALGIDTTNGDATQWTAFTTTNLGPALGLTKLGENTLTLNEPNTYAGPTIVRQGTLTLSATGNLGDGSNLLLEGGTIDLAGLNATVGDVVVSLASASGGALVNGNLTGTSYAISNTTGNAVISANLLANADVGLTKTGAGTATLEGANTYTGDTTVEGGTLFGGSGGSSVSNVVVSAGATFGAAVTTSNGQWSSTGGLTCPDDGTLLFDFGSTQPSTTVAPLQVATLTLGADMTVALQAADLTTLQGGQSYPLIQWTVSGPANADAITKLFAHRVAGTFSIQDNTLFLNVTSVTPGAITWNTGDGTWDEVTANWLDSAAVPTTYINPLDDVVFGDAAGVDVEDPMITLDSAFSPPTLTVNSADHDYTLTGTGSLTGATTLAVDQPADRTFTLGMANSFTGGTTILGGTLVTTNNLSLGGNNSVVTVADGATLNFNGAKSSSHDYHAFISGAGVDGVGAIINTITARQSGLGNLTLQGDATIGGTVRWDLRPLSFGVADLAGFNLSKVGANQIALIQCEFISDGTITVEEGILGLTRNVIAGDLPIIVNGGSRLFFENNSSGSFAKPVIVNGSTVQVGGSAVTTPRLVTVTGDCTFQMDAAFNLNGGLAGSGSINKTGGQALTINAASTHTGGITVAAGQLSLGTAGSIPTTSVTLNPGTIFNTSGQENHTLGSGQTITFGINPAGSGTSGRIQAAGLDVSNATASFTALDELDDEAYIIATYSTLTGGGFASATPPPGYMINYAYQGNQIALVEVGGDYALWALQFPGADLSDPNSDLDGDGVSNDEERIFGLNPTDPASVNPIAVPLNPATGTFSFTRRDPALTGLNYLVWTSTDLIEWEEDQGATLTPGVTADQVQTVDVTLSAALLAEPALFIRLSAEIPPPLFAASFEEDDGGFTVVTAGGSAWQWGQPNSASQGGGSTTTGNDGSLRCWGVNLTGGYVAGTDTSLRSPTINLTGATAASLSFARAFDAAALHTLEVTAIDATTGDFIATILPPTQDSDTTVSPWQKIGPVSLPAEALGREIRIQWRFVGNGDGSYNGVYIDDVIVTATQP